MSGLVVALAQAAALRKSAWWGGGGQSEGKLGPWSTIALAGQTFPGVPGPESPGAISVRVEGPGVGYSIDRQKEKAGDGHVLHVEGYQAKPFTLACRLHRAEQWEAFRAYMSVINPKLKENYRKAFAVSGHPVLSTYGIASIYIEEVAFPAEQERLVEVIRMTVCEVFGRSGKGSKKVAETDLIGGDNAGTLNPRFDLDSSPGAR